MAEKSGFFNALLSDGVYDRKYNANDYSDNLAVVINNGVLRTDGDDLSVTASGLQITMNAGRAWINGHYYYNSSDLEWTVPTPPVAGSRYDRIILRLDNSVYNRNIQALYIEGEAGASPVRPAPVRSGDIYDIVLADISVSANASSVSVTDKRADRTVCGWVYSTSGDNSFFTSLDNAFYTWFQERKDTLSSVTLFKRYTDQITIQSETSSVSFDIPQYDEETCFLEVYVNGILDSRHEIEDNIITFFGTLVGGTVVTVNCYKSIDGTGIQSVSDEITELQNAVAQMDGIARFTYRCNGLNDNISLSQIAAAIRAGHYDEDEVTEAAAEFLERLGGNEYLIDMYSNAQITIDIVGNCAASAPFAGAGTDASPYKWFSFGENAQGQKKKIVFDFARCQDLIILCTGSTTNQIFYGASVDLKNCRVSALNPYGATNNNILMIKCNGDSMNAVNAENCDFTVDTTGSARIAEHGIFTNCNGEVRSDAGAAYCFKPKSSTFIRLNGGSYLAYGRTSSGISSAICHTSESEADAVLMAYNIHCPILAKANMSQGFLSVANAGKTYINGVVSRLTSSGSYNEIIGQINKNKV